MTDVQYQQQEQLLSATQAELEHARQQLDDAHEREDMMHQQVMSLQEALQQLSAEQEATKTRLGEGLATKHSLPPIVFES
jgi:chromosome segregation ATPase